MNINKCNYKPVEYTISKKSGETGEKDCGDSFSPSSPEKEWTFLVFLDATKNHDKIALYKLKDLEKTGSNENVNIVAEVTRSKHFMDRITKDWQGTKRFYVTKGEKDKNIRQLAHLYLPGHTYGVTSPEVEKMDFQDPGDNQTLEQFLKWGMEKYPARHYGVLISSNGSGIEGIMGDENNRVTLPELGEIARNIKGSTGKKIDLMLLDESNSASMEVATELSGHVNYMIGSEGELKCAKIPFGKAIKTIKEGIKEEGTITPKEAALSFIYESGRRKYASVDTPSVSAIDLNKTDNVNKILAPLTEALKNHSDKKLLKNLVKKSQQFYNSKGKKEFLDLRDFTKVIADEMKVSDPHLAELAKELDKELGEMVIGNFYEGETFQNSRGIAIFAPSTKDERTEKISRKIYPELALNKETGWNDFINKIATDNHFKKFLSSVGVGEKELKVLDKFFTLTRQVFNVGVSIGSIGLALTCLDNVVNGQLAGPVGTAVALGLGGTEISYGIKNTYLYATNEEIKDRTQVLDPLFYTMEGIAITSTMSLPAKVLGAMGKQIVQGIGAMGGAYHAATGAYKVFSALNDDKLINKKEKVIDNTLDSMRGIAVVAVTMGIILGAGAAFTTPAGIVAAAIPVARAIYNILSNIKDLKAEDVDMKSFREKLAEIQDLSGARPKHYISPTIKGIIEGAGAI